MLETIRGCRGLTFRSRLRRTAVAVFIFFFVLALSFGKTSVSFAETADPLNLSAKSAILVDFNSGQILYEKDADHAYPPASMTKMMTEYLILQAIDSGKLSWDTKVSISDYAYDVSQNRAFSGVPLRKDYQYTVKELYEAMAIYSANGAAIALAEKVAGTEEKFVDLMNSTAKKLDMTEAHFINSTGLETADLGKYANKNEKGSTMLSARDLAKIAYHVIKSYPEVLEVSSIPLKEFTAGVDTPIKMTNWNWMLPGFGSNMNAFKYEGVDGLKTGHTDLAGYCFTGTVNRDGHRLISVVMGTDARSTSFNQTKALFDYGYQQFSEQTVAKENQRMKNQKPVAVHHGKKDSVPLAFGASVQVATAAGTENQYDFKVKLDDAKLNENGELEAPVKKGEKLGYATLSVKGDSAYGNLDGEQRVPVVAAEQVDRSNWFVRMMSNIGSFFSGVFSWIAGLF